MDPMIAAADEKSGLVWLLCSLLTVFCFGVYGNLLHTGQLGMKDPKVGRYKAFLMVGVAYFVVAVILPGLILLPAEGGFDFEMKGVGYSLVAGSFGAIGAFGILLAFGARGDTRGCDVDSLCRRPHCECHILHFLHPPAGGISSINPLFSWDNSGGNRRWARDFLQTPSIGTSQKPAEPKVLPRLRSPSFSIS